MKLSCKMLSIVAREVNFGMPVTYKISAERRAIETVASIDIPHSGICLNTLYFLRSSGAVGCNTW